MAIIDRSGTHRKIKTVQLVIHNGTTIQHDVECKIDLIRGCINRGGSTQTSSRASRSTPTP
jgi:hypothetical protein